MIAGRSVSFLCTVRFIRLDEGVGEAGLPPKAHGDKPLNRALMQPSPQQP